MRSRALGTTDSFCHSKPRRAEGHEELLFAEDNTNRPSRKFQFETADLGLIDLNEACDYQKKVLNEIKTNKRDSVLILCRHNPVITVGRQGKDENILCKKENIPVIKVERGGDVTYHGPGQLTVYPVFDLNRQKKDIHLFLRKLEGIVMSLLSGLGVEAQRIPGKTGVWAGNKKICSIGISVRNWITFHGLSLNVKNCDMAGFKLIRPCGMDITMTSVEEALGRDVDLDEVKYSLIYNFRREYECDLAGTN